MSYHVLGHSLLSHDVWEGALYKASFKKKKAKTVICESFLVPISEYCPISPVYPHYHVFSTDPI